MNPETKQVKGDGMSGETEQLFGAASFGGTRHAAYPAHGGRHSTALCDYSLNLTWLGPLQPGQKVCQRPTCKRRAEEALGAIGENGDER